MPCTPTATHHGFCLVRRYVHPFTGDAAHDYLAGFMARTDVAGGDVLPAPAGAAFLYLVSFLTYYLPGLHSLPLPSPLPPPLCSARKHEPRTVAQEERNADVVHWINTCRFVGRRRASDVKTYYQPLCGCTAFKNTLLLRTLHLLGTLGTHLTHSICRWLLPRGTLQTSYQRHLCRTTFRVDGVRGAGCCPHLPSLFLLGGLLSFAGLWRTSYITTIRCRVTFYAARPAALRATVPDAASRSCVFQPPTYFYHASPTTHGAHIPACCTPTAYLIPHLRSTGIHLHPPPTPPPRAASSALTPLYRRHLPYRCSPDACSSFSGRTGNQLNAVGLWSVSVYKPAG